MIAPASGRPRVEGTRASRVPSARSAGGPVGYRAEVIQLGRSTDPRGTV